MRGIEERNFEPWTSQYFWISRMAFYKGINNFYCFSKILQFLNIYIKGGTSFRPFKHIHNFQMYFCEIFIYHIGHEASTKVKIRETLNQDKISYLKTCIKFVNMLLYFVFSQRNSYCQHATLKWIWKEQLTCN